MPLLILIIACAPIFIITLLASILTETLIFSHIIDQADKNNVIRNVILINIFSLCIIVFFIDFLVYAVLIPILMPLKVDMFFALYIPIITIAKIFSEFSLAQYFWNKENAYRLLPYIVIINIMAILSVTLYMYFHPFIP